MKPMGTAWLLLILCSCATEPLLVINKHVIPMSGVRLTQVIQPLATDPGTKIPPVLQPVSVGGTERAGALQLRLPSERVGGIVPLEIQGLARTADTTVDFYLDGIAIGSIQGTDAILQWDSRKTRSGSHQLTAKVQQGTQEQNLTHGIWVDHLPEIVALKPSRNPVPGAAYPVSLQAQVRDQDTELSQLTYTWDAGAYNDRLKNTDLTSAMWFSPVAQKRAVETYRLKLKVSDATSTVEKTVDVKVNHQVSHLKIN